MVWLNSILLFLVLISSTHHWSRFSNDQQHGSFLVSAEVQEAPDGSVCFNNCNGHGDCIDYSCHCWSGYLGDDCRTTFADDENDIVPILTAGHFNLTRKNFTQAIIKNKLILVGFSSLTCHKCIRAEPAYRNISQVLKDELQIPFARADAVKLKSIAAEVGAVELPALVLFQKQRPLVYRGAHTAESVLAYLRKVKGKPALPLKSVEDVQKFLSSRDDSRYGLSTVMTVGFFSEHEDIEEDEYEDFMEVAKELQVNEDIYFGVVTKPATANWFKKNKTIDRTPSLVMRAEGGEQHAVNLDELFGDMGGIKEWVAKHAIPLVGKMTPQNFQLYEKQGLPILMMFLDLTDERAVVTTTTPSPADDASEGSTDSVSFVSAQHVGGKSGGIFNEVLIEELRIAAKEHRDRILFVYLDGTKHFDQMKSLGLYGGKEALPSLAFNTRDGTQAPFPEELPINSETILQFCADFISGKIRSVDDAKEMAKKALQATVPLSSRNKVTRKERKKPIEKQQGVAEGWGDGIRGDDAVTVVTLDNFDDIVLNEDKDVVLLLHAETCDPCAHFAVYYKRMAARFRELGIPSLEIARMDVSSVSPPAHMNLMVGNLPIVAMIPASDKQPPWNFYSGISKVQPMMKWVQSQASIPFELENLPHLVDADKVAYKEQVRQREEALDEKRREEQQAMEEEERAQALLKSRKKMKSAEEESAKTAPAHVEMDTVDQQSGVGINSRVSSMLMDNDEF